MSEADINEIMALAVANLKSAMASPKPTYRSGEHSVNWNEYIKMQKDMIAFCESELAKIPAEEITYLSDYISEE